MNLEKFCSDSWVIKKGRLRESKHCSDEIDLYLLIQEFQWETISEDCSEKLFKCVICGAGKVQKVWRELKQRIFACYLFSYFMTCPEKKHEFFDDCFNEIAAEILDAVRKFNLDRLEHTDNLNVMRLLSKYIDGSLYCQNIYEKKIENDLKDTDELVSEPRLNDNNQNDADVMPIIVLEKIWEDAIENGPRLLDFINEAKAGQSEKSDRARTQKCRLKRYIQTRWNLSDSDSKDVVDGIHQLIEGANNAER
jgi:hypothetical protein